MKQFRRLVARGILVPIALMALVVTSSLPASAATLPGNTTSTTTTTVQTSSHTGGPDPLSINW